MIRLEVGIQGNVQETLKEFEKGFRDQVIVSAARKASRPIINASRQEVRKISEQATTSQDASKSAYIARQIKAFKSKSKTSPGVAIYVKGADVFVHDRFWTSGAYAILLGEGSYKKPQGRRWRRPPHKYTGKFKGFGNFMEKGFQIGASEASAIFMKEIDNVINLNK